MLTEKDDNYLFHICLIIDNDQKNLTRCLRLCKEILGRKHDNRERMAVEVTRRIWAHIPAIRYLPGGMSISGWIKFLDHYEGKLRDGAL